VRNIQRGERVYWKDCHSDLVESGVVIGHHQYHNVYFIVVDDDHDGVRTWIPRSRIVHVEKSAAPDRVVDEV